MKKLQLAQSVIPTAMAAAAPSAIGYGGERNSAHVIGAGAQRQAEREAAKQVANATVYGDVLTARNQGASRQVLRSWHRRAMTPSKKRRALFPQGDK